MLPHQCRTGQIMHFEAAYQRRLEGDRRDFLFSGRGDYQSPAGTGWILRTAYQRNTDCHRSRRRSLVRNDVEKIKNCVQITKFVPAGGSLV